MKKSIVLCLALTFAVLMSTLSWSQEQPPGPQSVASSEARGDQERSSKAERKEKSEKPLTPTRNHEKKKRGARQESTDEAQERTDFVAKMRARKAEGTGSRAAARCWHDTPGANEPDGVVLDHMNWCKTQKFTFVSQQCRSMNPPIDCKPIGAYEFKVLFTGEGHQGGSLSDRKHQITVNLQEPKVAWGAPRSTDRMTISGVCPSSENPRLAGRASAPKCTTSGALTQTLAQWMDPQLSTAWITYTSPEGSGHPDEMAWHAAVIKMSSETDEANLSGPIFRCDSATYFAWHYGCVYPDSSRPDVFTLTVDDEVRDSANLIWAAQNRPNDTFPISPGGKKIPGSVASGDALTRTNPANLEGNRNESKKQCKIFFGEQYSKGETLDCDEYPFASTQQGSKTGRGTGEESAHYAVLPLDKHQNRKAGGRLEKFYNDQRIARDEDPFFVKLVNPNGDNYGGAQARTGMVAKAEYPVCANNDVPDVQAVEKKAYPEGALLQYAKDTDSGWTGGDSTYTVVLPDGRRLYLFSDTFLGPLNADGTRPTKAKFINSSIVVEKGASLSTITGGTKARPKALMPPAVKDRWYWLGDGMVSKIGGKNYLQIMFQEYRNTHDGTEMPFAFARNVVATFDLDDLSQPIWIDPLPSDTGVAWGSALLPASRSGDGYTYIYGVSKHKVNKKMRIARVKGSDLSQADKWQFFNAGELGGDKWMRSEKEGNEYLEGVSNEYSVTPWNKQFVLISQDSTAAFSAKIRAWSGCTPYGPFGYREGADEVYRTTEGGPPPWGSYGDGRVFTYNAHAHPSLQNGDRWTISYNVNTFDSEVSTTGSHYRDPSIYKPRFVSFRLVPARGISRASKQFKLVE
ncbi:hypothetical protein [Streptomyces sp. CC224B]|uniref:NucA/NucB deoxyribonuclease domain-containing protein n=1 Tax=Streptomyces sp. CC224B TaxID=3044571 RepID=UPI0024A7C0B8|nr:hypothetical protein [Streptomyces sp. CC224B]